MSFAYRYPRPAVTVDAAVFSQDGDAWQILLIQRKNEPFKDLWALPGGFLDENEDPDQAALRELEEETSLHGVSLNPLGFWGRPGRDPRGHTVSLVYWGVIDACAHQPVAADDAKALAWYPIAKLPELAFDHAAVLEAAIRQLSLQSVN